MARIIFLTLFATLLACPWDKGMDEVVQSCSTCLDVNFDDLESQLGVVLGPFSNQNMIILPGPALVWLVPGSQGFSDRYQSDHLTGKSIWKPIPGSFCREIQEAGCCTKSGKTIIGHSVVTTIVFYQ